ncbi:MAG: hypothetical protein E7343_04720 [Clostridiales bacterium]|nr:hypothetical protein [Clostridiales bacterium]
MKKNEIIQTITNLEIQPYIPKSENDLANYQKFPLAEIGTLGLTFDPIMKTLQKITNSDVGEKLYRIANKPLGTHLAKVQGENGKFIGALVKDGTGVIGQARFVEATGKPALPPINPALLSMALVLITVNKKLDSVFETGQQILAFLEEKEKAKLEGNLEILSDIFNNYKFNLENQLYKTNKHVQVQSVKADAEQSIKLYRSQIEKEINKKTFIHSDHAVKGKIAQIEKFYRNYQLALYIYSFAYFLEVMLFENFEKRYLESITKTIEKHCEEYQTLYQSSYRMIKEYSKTSMQTYAVKALSGISKSTGKVLSKTPIINKTQLDENLITAGKNLENTGEERTNVVMNNLLSGDTDFINPFMDNIRIVNFLQNEPLELLVDKEMLYIKNS